MFSFLNSCCSDLSLFAEGLLDFASTWKVVHLYASKNRTVLNTTVSCFFMMSDMLKSCVYMPHIHMLTDVLTDSTPSDNAVSLLSDESRPEDDSVFLSPTKARTTEDLFAMIHR